MKVADEMSMRTENDVARSTWLRGAGGRATEE
jgi:hypothetical protein